MNFVKRDEYYFREKWVIVYGYNIYGRNKQNQSATKQGHWGDKEKDSNIQETSSNSYFKYFWKQSKLEKRHKQRKLVGVNYIVQGRYCSSLV